MANGLAPIKCGDHLLWPDGDITVDPDRLTDYIFRLPADSLKHLTVARLTPEVVGYNAVTDHPIRVKGGCTPDLFPPRWVLPDAYKYLDLDEYLLKLADRVERDSLYEQRVERLAREIWLFKEQNLDDILRCLIYVVEALTTSGAIWGVGRGSSCSSYLLYLLGLHAVDAVKYDIDISDFLKPQGN